MTASRDWQIASAVLRLTTQLVDGIQEGVAAAGFTDVRPGHGFAFLRIAQGPTSIADLAAHLGITKQAASQLVAQLEDRGYLSRTTDPQDRRAQLLALTARGTACTKAAQRAATRTVQQWHAGIEPAQVARLAKTLVDMTTPGPVRPTW